MINNINTGQTFFIFILIFFMPKIIFGINLSYAENLFYNTPEKTAPLTINSFSTAPNIDGDLSDETWLSAVVLKNFIQTFPGDNVAPTYNTEVFIGHDTGTLYIGISAKDEPGSVRATLAKRDDILNDDNIKIYLDTFNDSRRAYLLIFNPFGIQHDGIFVEGIEEPDYSVDIVMDSKGKLTPDGYTIEIAVPFSSLRYQSGEEQTWGIHVIRTIKHLNDEENSWMPLKRGSIGLLNQAGKITGFKDISGNMNLEIIPTFTLSGKGQRVFKTNKEDFVNDPFKGDPGLSLKLNTSSNLTFDLTLNPDFAQVEADQFVVTANQRFPIFYEEKRPFFLEGIDIFQTPLQTVHTRTIIEPNAAVKMSGKYNDYTFGVLASSDKAPGTFSDEELTNPAIRTGIEKFIGEKAYTTIARLKKDIGKESFVGFTSTSYNFIEKENYTAGLDGRINFNSNNAFSFQVLGTLSNSKFYEPALDENVYRKGYGFGYLANFKQSGRNFNFTIEGQGRTPDYRANVGFTTQTNINRWSFLFRYNSDPQKDAALISWSFLFTLLTDFDWQGRMKYAYVYPRVLLNFPKQSFINIYAYTDYLKLLEEEFGPARTATQAGAFYGSPERHTVYKGFTVEAGTTPVKEITLYFLVDRAWDNFDYDFGAGKKFPRVSPAALKDQNAPLDPGKGNTTDINASINFKPNENLRFSFNYIKSRLFRGDTKKLAFDQNIYLLGTTYQFTSFSFVRLRFEYETLKANIRTQILLGWTPNPGTALYLGYNEDLNYDGYNPFTQKYEPGFQPNNRLFFLKLSYMLQFGV